MYFKQQRWIQELSFWLVSIILAYIYFYLITHKRPPLTIVLALGLIIAGYVFYLLLKKAKWALYIIFIFLPFYPFIRIQLLRFEIVGQTVIFFISRWPEALMIMALFGRKWGGIKRIFYSASLLDFLTISFILYGFGYFIYSLSQGRWMLGMWGMKDDFLFYIYYFLVRLIPLGREDVKNFLKISALIAAGIALFGIIQSLFFGEDFLVKLGYGQEVKGTDIQYLGQGHLRGDIYGAGGFVRAISILQDPLSLAAYLMVFALIIQPFYFFPKENGQSFLKTIQYFLILAGLFFTTTRSAWIGVALGALFVAWRIKRLLFTASILSFFGVIALIVLFMLPGGKDFFLGTFTVEEGSAYQHYIRYGWHFRNMLQHPMGMGLGMAGRVATYFGAQTLGGFHTECWYLQIGNEMGIFAFVIYILIILETLRKLFMVSHKLKDPFLRDTATGIFAAYLGLAIFGIFLNVWGFHLIPVFMHLLIGITLFHFPTLDQSALKEDEF